MKRIIVPTNFSTAAWNATLHALEYCKLFKTELNLFHVYENSNNELNVSSVDVNQTLSDEEDQMKNLLVRIKELPNFNDVEIKTICINSSLFEGVKSILSEDGADLLIMGTAGRKGTVAKLFGSHTSRMIKEIDCPIMVIPEKFEFSFVTSVTCAIDHGSEVNNTDLNLLKQLVNSGSNSIFKIIHIIKDLKDPNKSLPLEQFADFNITYDEIVGDSVPILLEKYSKINNSRLLAIIRKEKGFFVNLFQLSVSIELTINANVPVLVLRAK